MKQFDRITPEGTRDLLFEECLVRGRLQRSLANLFQLRGFDEVITPALEFYDVFTDDAAYLPQQSMFKLTDHKGRLLVLRPDCTTPIARLAATRLKGAASPLRFYYKQNVYRMERQLAGKSCEITQAGVELMGAPGEKSDLEMVELACASLRECAGESYRIELCHIGFFKAIMQSLGTDAATAEKIRQLVENKNYAALGDMLAQFGENDAVCALKRLPRLFGGEEILEEAAEVFCQNGAREVLDDLKSLYRSLESLGLRDKVMVDLGLVSLPEYYTGITFQGYLSGIGEPVLSGGRYDSLVGQFGRQLPAVGFAINVDLVGRYLMASGMGCCVKSPDILVHSDKAHMAKAIRYRNLRISEGFLCEVSSFDTAEEAKAYALGRGISQLHLVGDTVEILRMAGADYE